MLHSPSVQICKMPQGPFGHSYALWTPSICDFSTQLQDVGFLPCICCQSRLLGHLSVTSNWYLMCFAQHSSQREVKVFIDHLISLRVACDALP